MEKIVFIPGKSYLLTPGIVIPNIELLAKMGVSSFYDSEGLCVWANEEVINILFSFWERIEKINI